uniref:ABC-type xenobiotic transporter n=1 Tax=Diaphorina citri TaxID=121845 RepID=A0A6G5VBL2_DIACI|nr:ATP-binding cassette transporter [Diaphorina citri]
MIFILPLIRCNLELLLKPASLFPVDVVLAVVQTLAWGVHLACILTIRFSECGGLRGPTLLGSLWMLYFAFSCLYVPAQYVTLMYSDLHVTYFYFALAQMTLLVLYGATMIPGDDHNAERLRHHNFLQTQITDRQRLVHYSRFREDFDRDYLGTAMENAGLLSRLLFGWVEPLMSKGMSGTLQCTDDLFDLPESLTSKHLYDKLNDALMITSTIEVDAREERGGTSYAQIPRPSLLSALHFCFGREFYACGALKLISDLAGFAAPLLLYQLVNFIETGTEPFHYGALYAGALTLTTIIAALCNEHFGFQSNKVSLKIRGSLVTIIYKKTLNLSVLTLNSISVGEIVNHISTDTDRIVGACASFHALWSIPLQLTVTLYLLYMHLGVAAFTGVVFSLLLIPVNKVIADRIASYSSSNMTEKDERVRLMSEILRGIRSIKLYAWEKFFTARVNRTRARELYYLKWRKYLDALCVYFWATTPVSMSLLTFSAYVMLGNPLTAATVFTSMALLNMLIGPLNAFPWVLNGLTEAWVSVKRVQKLLDLPETDHTAYYSHINKLKSKDSNEMVIILNATFTWHTPHFIMSHISASIPRGQLTGVCGPVGSGKSSLLMAICGEIDKQSGVLGLGPDEMENGFSLVTQTPWLQHGTVRDNILFGLPYDETFYNTVLEACALKSDLQTLPGGDLAWVGEGGLTLSGGQKARLSLARAVYQNKDIFLLDDILAALDATVASHVFSQCVQKLLLGRGKTVVMATHLTQYLVSAHHVLVMSSGCLVAQGLPSQVLPNYNDLALGVSDPSPSPPSSPLHHSTSRSSSLVESDVHEEITRTGSLAFNVYAAYIRGVGTVMSLCVLVFLITMQLTKNGGDWWFSYWLIHQNQTEPPSNTTEGIENYPVILNMVSLIESRLPAQVAMNFSNFLFIYCTIGTFNSLTALGRAFTFAIGGIHAATKLHDQLLTSIMKARVLVFDLSPVGRILNRFSSDVDTIDDSLPFILNILLASLFSVLGAMIIIVYSLPWLILVLLPLIPLYHRLQNHYRNTSREVKRLSSKSLSPLYSHFNETLQGLSSVRAYRAVARFKRENEDKLENNQKARFASAIIQNWLGLRLQMIGVLVVAGVGVVALVQHHHQMANPALVGLAVSYALSLTSVLSSLINSMTETEKEMVAVERVTEYINISKEEDRVLSVKLPYAWPASGVVQFNNVQLRYRSQLSLSLKMVSFETLPAEKIGVVGRTGAGKSSLLVALFRLTEISGGTIYVDKINIANVSLSDLRSRFFVIPQDPFLFSGTIRQNLDPNKRYRDSEIWTALQKCHLIPVVKKLGGLNATLTHEGTNLSNGQKQLMCLVRALLQNAKILFIDEATASVDQDTDRQIQNTIRSCFLHSTVFIIAHRIHSVMSCDRVLVMSGGEVIEFDSPQNLRQDKNSAFYALVTQNDTCS